MMTRLLVLILFISIFNTVIQAKDYTYQIINNILPAWSLSSLEVVKLYENNFKRDTILEVKELDGYYIILSSTINFGIDESRKLNLIAKYLILKHLKKNNKKITAITLHGFSNAAQWKNEDRLYLLSFVKQNGVETDYAPVKKRENRSILDDEIALLEQSRNKDEVIHRQLKNLYFQKGDMENYNREVDILMDKKFNEL